MVIFNTTLHTQDIDSFATQRLVRKENSIYMHFKKKSHLDDILIYYRSIHIQHDDVFSLIWIICLACISSILFLCPLQETKGSPDLEGKVK